MQGLDIHPPPGWATPGGVAGSEVSETVERPAPAYGGDAARAAPTWEHRAGDTNRLTRQALGAGCEPA